MKKFSVFILAAFVSAASVFAADISVTLDGEEIAFSAQEPVIREGRTLIPLRGVFEKLGYEITFHADTKTAVFAKDGTTVEITAGSSTFLKDGESKALEEPAVIINDSMMLPLRSVGEAFGLTVSWDSDTKTVSLLTEAPQTENTEATGITVEEEEALKTAADFTAKSWESMFLFGSYKEVCSEITDSDANGSIGEYSREELDEFLADIPVLTETYKNLLKDIGFPKAYGSCEEKFIEMYDVCEKLYTYGTQLAVLTNSPDASADEISETEELCSTYKKEYDKAAGELAYALYYGVGTNLSNEAAVKFSSSLNPSEDETAENSKYSEEITAFLDSNEILSGIMYAEPESLTEDGDILETAAEELREKLDTTETPATCVLDKYMLYKACDLLSEAGKITEESGFMTEAGNEAYMKYCYTLKTALYFLDCAGENTVGISEALTDEIEFNVTG